MSELESRWYRCSLTEQVQDEEEPDWSRVPEAKREAVRGRWIASHQRTETSEVNLWGPQIPFFARQYRVEVIQ